MTLETGAATPTVRAENQDGETVELTFDEPTVLYFYPKDETPGCSLEARQFQTELATYRDAGVDLYGVSFDDADAHAAFCESEGLEFDLLADPEGEIAAAFDVERREVKGHTVTARTTFVCADGTVQAVYTGVDPDGHARTVLGDMLDDGLVSLPQ